MARVAIVTGGTRGIGEAICKRLQRQGHTVIANYAGNDNAAKAFSDETGIPARKWDVGDHAACIEGCAAVEAEFGPVDIVINNHDDAIHPFHLHGHQFQVMDRPRSGTGDYPGRTNGFAAKPPMRDVVSVNGKSYAVLRFKASNPGVFLFHCHIEWHVGTFSSRNSWIEGRGRN